MNKKIKGSETGRSMVEMLGVLAIIGILSVVGIKGYQDAMLRRATSELVYGLNLEAINLSALSLRRADLVAMSAKVVNKYDMTVAYMDKVTGSFKINVTDIPYDVCQSILNVGWRIPTDILVNGTLAGLGNRETVCSKTGVDAMEFQFTSNLDPK